MMKTKLVGFGLFLLIFSIQTNFAVTLPAQIKSYLDKNHQGWKLSPSKQSCGSETNNGVVKGNFNEDRNIDYAVKFTQGKKGYIIAFLARNQNYKAFVLHDYKADDAKNEYLTVSKRGELFESEGKSFRLKFDAIADYFCESDVGGIHLYRNGKFVAY